MAQKVSVDSQHLIIHGPSGSSMGDPSIDLPFMLRPELLHKSDLAEIFARKLAERLPDSLDCSGPLTLRIPLEWGSVLLELPLADLAGMENPLSHLEWELERNASESAHSYLLDYQDLAGTRVRLVALRRPVEDFLNRSFSSLGFSPIRFEVVDLKGQVWSFDPDHARTLQEARGMERWKPASLPGWLLPGVLATAAGLLGLGWWLGSGQVSLPTADPALVDNRLPVSPDSLQATARPEIQDSTITSTALLHSAETGSALWHQLLQSLARGEARLPGFVGLHQDGILVNGTVDLAALLAPIGVQATHAGREARWYTFSQPLPDGAPTPARYFTVADLSSLADSLPEPIDRVLLSRRSKGGWRVAVQP
jgi:hypothetical protein